MSTIRKKVKWFIGRPELQRKTRRAGNRPVFVKKRDLKPREAGLNNDFLKITKTAAEIMNIRKKRLLIKNY
jgi:hypothetical protein